MVRGILFFICLSASLRVYGQNTRLLILERTGSRNRITYTIGDVIILKLKGEDFEIRDEITNIDDSILFLSEFFIPVSSIKYIKTVHKRGFLSPSNGPKLMIAGGALILIDIFNQTVIQGDPYQYNKGVTITSASLIAAGGILMSLKYRKFKPGKNRRIRTFVN